MDITALPKNTTPKQFEEHLTKCYLKYSFYSYRMFLKKGKGLVFTNWYHNTKNNLILSYCDSIKYKKILEKNKTSDIEYFRLHDKYNPELEVFLGYEFSENNQNYFAYLLLKFDNVLSPKDIYETNNMINFIL